MLQLVSVTGSLDGRSEIIMLNPNDTGNGGVFHINQTAEGINSGWAPWDTLGAQSSSLAMAVSGLDGHGDLALAWLNDGVIWVAPAGSPGAALETPIALDISNLRALTIATNDDGRLEFLALDNNGSLWSVAQSVQNSWENMNTHSLSGTQLQQISVTPYKDGRLTVVALGGDGGVYRIEQNGPNQDWGNWISLGGFDIQGVSARANADFRLEVVAVGGDGGLWDFFEHPDGSWSPWEIIAQGHFVGQPALVQNDDGRLEVFSLSSDGNIYHTYQQPKAGDAWMHSTVLVPAASPVDSFSVTKQTDGRLVLVVAHQQACSCTVLSQSVKNALTLVQNGQQPSSPCATAPKAVLGFLGEPRFTPQYPVDQEAFSWSIVVENGGKAVSAAFDVVLHFDSVQYSSTHQGPVAAGGTATVTGNIGPLLPNQYDLTWSIPQYSTATFVVTLSIPE